VYQAEGNLEEPAKLLPDVNAQTPSSLVFLAKMTQLAFERHPGEAVRLLQARLAQFQFGSEIVKAFTQMALAWSQGVAADTAGAKSLLTKHATRLSRSVKINQITPFMRHSWPKLMLCWATRIRH